MKGKMKRMKMNQKIMKIIIKVKARVKKTNLKK